MSGGGYQNRKGIGTEGEVTAGKVHSWPDPLGAVGLITPQLLPAPVFCIRVITDCGLLLEPTM